MIWSFRNRDTANLYITGKSRKWAGIARVALRKLDMLEAAERIEDLKSPPANRLEPLSRDRTGQYSIRINDQYRICFLWKDDGAHAVEIVDYH